MLIVPNSQFIADPEGFLKYNMVDTNDPVSRSLREAHLGGDVLLDDCPFELDFELVPLGPAKVGLWIVGTRGQYRIKRKDSKDVPITGKFMGFQYNVAGPGQMARISADNTGPSFIFTVAITGCTIVGVRRNGRLTFYHEPTREVAPGQWLDQYPGDIVLRAPTRTGHGTAVMHRYDGVHWRVYMQNFDFHQQAWAQTPPQHNTNLFQFYSFAGLDVFDEV